ncbi:hypothetical protein PoB_006428700 [Plakobranchus ocellatus]|uniref:Uncharacterized protein n=1 Tax=Plakobranchus ocellatus TaxID=259542 RepID=A0AAV4D0W0_9GAST|nr:hypothetical protein PoB_006428700 [Plakobranchus ocellatus]
MVWCSGIKEHQNGATVQLSFRIPLKRSPQSAGIHFYLLYTKIDAFYQAIKAKPLGVGLELTTQTSPANPRQVRYCPGLAIELVTKISAVGSFAKSIVFGLVHTALPSRPVYDCGDQLNATMKDPLFIHNQHFFHAYFT